MIVQHNIMALNSYRQLSGNNNALANNLEKLSSGYKINRAGDDAAGLAVSEKMRAQLRGLETAQKNANDGISLIQTAEGALTEVHSMLNRMSELAGLASNGIYEDEDLNNYQSEFEALQDEIDRISQATNFNGKNLLDGTLGTSVGVTAAKGTFGTVKVETTVGTTLKLADVGAITYAADGSATTAGVTVDLGDLASTPGKTDGITVTFGAPAGDTYTYTNEMVNNAVKAACDIAMANLDLSVTNDKDTYDFLSNLKNSFNAGFKGNVTIDGDATLPDDATLTFSDGTTTGAGGLTLQIGETNANYNQITVSIGNMNSASLGVGKTAVKVDDQTNAQAAIGAIKNAISTVSTTRGTLGALQNRLDHTINNLSVTTENVTDAESRIRDTDMASEMMEYTKNNILVQAAQAMLAQANQVPQGVLQLLR